MKIRVEFSEMDEGERTDVMDVLTVGDFSCGSIRREYEYGVHDLADAMAALHVKRVERATKAREEATASATD